MKKLTILWFIITSVLLIGCNTENTEDTNNKTSEHSHSDSFTSLIVEDTEDETEEHEVVYKETDELLAENLGDNAITNSETVETIESSEEFSYDLSFTDNDKVKALIKRVYKENNFSTFEYIETIIEEDASGKQTNVNYIVNYGGNSWMIQLTPSGEVLAIEDKYGFLDKGEEESEEVEGSNNN